MSDAGITIPFSLGDIGIPSLTSDTTDMTDTSIVPSVSDIVAGALAPTSVSPVDLSSLITGVPSVDTSGDTTASVTGGSDYQSIVNALPSLAKLGVNTYAGVLAAQQNPQAYLQAQGVAPAVVQPTTTDVSTSAASSLATLFDFTQPWPYLLIGGAVLIVVASSKKKR